MNPEEIRVRQEWLAYMNAWLPYVLACAHATKVLAGFEGEERQLRKMIQILQKEPMAALSVTNANKVRIRKMQYPHGMPTGTNDLARFREDLYHRGPLYFSDLPQYDEGPMIIPEDDMARHQTYRRVILEWQELVGNIDEQLYDLRETLLHPGYVEHHHRYCRGLVDDARRSHNTKTNKPSEFDKRITSVKRTLHRTHEELKGLQRHAEWGREQHKIIVQMKERLEKLVAGFDDHHRSLTEAVRSHSKIPHHNDECATEIIDHYRPQRAKFLDGKIHALHGPAHGRSDKPTGEIRRSLLDIKEMLSDVSDREIVENWELKFESGTMSLFRRQDLTGLELL